MRRIVPCLCLLAFVLAGCAAFRPEPPEVHLADVRLDRLGLFEQRYRVGLRMRNPNDRALEFESLRFELSVAGRHLADGVSSARFSLPAGGERRIEVLVSSDLGSLFDVLGDWLGDDITAVPYRISGEARLAGRDRHVPFERDGRLELLPRRAAPTRFDADARLPQPGAASTLASRPDAAD